MRVGLVQMRSGTDPERNSDDALASIREAAGEGADLVATPEMTTLLQRDRAALDRDVRDEADTVAPFAEVARELGVHVLIGSAAIREGDTLRNRSLLISPEGAVAARYDKMHMFDVDVSATERWRESATYSAGDGPVTALVGEAQLGLSVCYDLRFPELYRHYARAGCGVVSVPAAFTVPTGRAHWHVLLRARAIETGAFVLAPAQGGLHADGRTTYGHSLVVGPWGEVVAELDHDEPGVLMADLDLSQVAHARARIPAWRAEPRI